MRNNKPYLASGLVALFMMLAIQACTEKFAAAPTSAQVESVAIRAYQGRQDAAMKQLEHWAESGLPIAQRELALILQHSPDKLLQARQWFEKAATGGDGESAYQLGDAYYFARLGAEKDTAIAWKWYQTGARHGDDRSALMLSRMAKYGDGIPLDLAESVRWLTLAAERGNAQAMFLLSNAYQSGEGVKQDATQAREWLEKSAAGDYPVAIQALALAVENGDLHMTKDAKRAEHLFKEASEERRDHWNNFQ